MAIFIMKREWVNDPQNGGLKEIVGYAVDDAGDLPSLPVAPAIGGGSTAIVGETGDVYLLRTVGWAIL
jgi:hypothetical protein